MKTNPDHPCLRRAWWPAAAERLLARPAPRTTTRSIVIGYQSKTINTVTAGTLLRDLGYFEERLEEIDPDLRGRVAGLRHRRADHRPDAGGQDRHRLDGRLPAADQRVPRRHRRRRHLDGRGHRLQPARRAQRRRRRARTPTPRRSATSKGGDISASVGSAGHGTLVQALRGPGHRPQRRRQGREPGPAVGASSLQGGSVDAVVAVRGLAGPAGLPRRRPAGLRRRPARPADPARHGRPQRVRRRARGDRRRVPPGADRRHRLPPREPASRRPRSWPTRPACRPRSSTSTTAATGSRPSTPRSSRSRSRPSSTTCRS